MTPRSNEAADILRLQASLIGAGDRPSDRTLAEALEHGAKEIDRLAATSAVRQEPAGARAGDGNSEPDFDAWQCERCNGDGWHWEMAQVGERKSDQQELKTDCRECDCLGWLGPDAQAAADHAKEKTNV